MTSKAEEIFNSLLAEFPHFLDEVTVLSRNTDAKKDFILCEDKAINFDKVWNFSRTGKNMEKSPDTIFFSNDTLYFVEFKEGRHFRDDVRQKIHEGILTLFQFAKAKGLVDRASFSDVKIRFALVRRLKEEGNPFLDALDDSIDLFDLKNMEGFLVDKIAVRSKPELIAAFLNKASGGVIKKIAWVSRDQMLKKEISV